MLCVLHTLLYSSLQKGWLPNDFSGHSGLSALCHGYPNVIIMLHEGNVDACLEEIG